MSGNISRKYAQQYSSTLPISKPGHQGSCPVVQGCNQDSPCRQRLTSHVLPIYPCYSHSVADQNALLDFLENAPYSTQDLCLATPLLSPAKRLHEPGSSAVPSPAAALLCTQGKT